MLISVSLLHIHHYYGHFVRYSLKLVENHFWMGENNFSMRHTKDHRTDNSFLVKERWFTFVETIERLLFLFVEQIPFTWIKETIRISKILRAFLMIKSCMIKSSNCTFWFASTDRRLPLMYIILRLSLSQVKTAT